jgi:hypothetical protein
MFRGFEMILKGKDPQAGLIVTPRICGICGGSHLYKSATPRHRVGDRPAAERHADAQHRSGVRDAAVDPALVLRAVRHRPHVNKKYAKSPLYDEAMRRFAPYVGTSYETGVVLSAQAGRGLRHLRWPVAALVVHDPRRRDVRSDAGRRDPLDRDPRELEGVLAREELARLLDRALAREQDLGGRARLDRRERGHHNSDCGSSSATAWTSASTSTARATGTTSRPAPTSSPSEYDAPDDRRAQRA